MCLCLKVSLPEDTVVTNLQPRKIQMLATEKRRSSNPRATIYPYGAEAAQRLPTSVGGMGHTRVVPQARGPLPDTAAPSLALEKEVDSSLGAPLISPNPPPLGSCTFHSHITCYSWYLCVQYQSSPASFEPKHHNV